jgi:hypothetical protein
VAYLATPPADLLSEEAFSQQVLALVAKESPQYLADTIVARRAAHERLGQQVPALVTYSVNVWDLAQSTSAKPLGKFCLVAEAPTAAECLAVLVEKLAELAITHLYADPLRFGNQQLASHLALVAAA